MIMIIATGRIRINAIDKNNNNNLNTFYITVADALVEVSIGSVHHF